jgi:hypothetical protein
MGEKNPAHVLEPHYTRILKRGSNPEDFLQTVDRRSAYPTAGSGFARRFRAVFIRCAAL